MLAWVRAWHGVVASNCHYYLCGWLTADDRDDPGCRVASLWSQYMKARSSCTAPRLSDELLVTDSPLITPSVIVHMTHESHLLSG